MAGGGGLNPGDNALDYKGSGSTGYPEKPLNYWGGGLPRFKGVMPRTTIGAVGQLNRAVHLEGRVWPLELRRPAPLISGGFDFGIPTEP